LTLNLTSHVSYQSTLHARVIATALPPDFTQNMALPLLPGLTPSEVAYLCEMELVTVLPRQRLESLDLLAVSLLHFLHPIPHYCRRFVLAREIPVSHSSTSIHAAQAIRTVC
jgi:hypothetical protein